MLSIRLDLGPGASAMSVSGHIPGFVPPGVKALALPCQTHTANVAVAELPLCVFPDTDALLTSDLRVAVGVRTADCVPILLHAPDIRMVGAVHAGWKGTVARIAENAVGRLVAAGADPAEIRVAFGPRICGQCYETGAELAEAFVRAGLGDSVIRGGGEDPCGEKRFDLSSVRIDLEAANRIVLSECGIAPENITSCGICTRHDGYPGGAWPSWRRTPGLVRRLVTMAWLGNP